MKTHAAVQRPFLASGHHGYGRYVCRSLWTDGSLTVVIRGVPVFTMFGLVKHLLILPLIRRCSPCGAGEAVHPEAAAVLRPL